MREDQLLIKSLLSDEALSTEGSALMRAAKKHAATPAAPSDTPPTPIYSPAKPPRIAAGKAAIPMKHSAFHPLRLAKKFVLFPILRPLVRPQASLSAKRTWQNWAWIALGNVATRLLLAPIFLALFCLYLVYTTTHPATVMAMNTPTVKGLSYKQINFMTDDHVGLAGWLVPALGADDLASASARSLLKKHPATILCHGLGQSHDQYLTLARELHIHGFTVLLLDTRGQGDSNQAAVTFGLREHLDLLAAVAYLRSLQEVDGSRIAIVGHDMAATAALQTAVNDGEVAAVVVDGLPTAFDERTAEIFSHPFGAYGPGAKWLAHLYTATFEMSFRDDITPLDPDVLVPALRHRPLLCVARHGELYTSTRELLRLTAGDSKHLVLVPSELPTTRTIDETIAAFVSDALSNAPK